MGSNINDITEVSIADDKKHTPEHHDVIPEIPVAVDPHRPPVRNDANAYQCACECTLDKSNKPEASTSEEPFDPRYNSYTSSENGDEGAEEHLIDVGDFGQIPAKEIYRALAKHGRLHHHRHGILPSDYSPSVHSLESSMVVEARTETSSVFSQLSQRSLESFSSSSSLLRFTGDWLNHMGTTTFTSGTGTVYNPLPLTPEYPDDVEISDKDLRDLPSFDLGFL